MTTASNEDFYRSHLRSSQPTGTVGLQSPDEATQGETSPPLRGSLRKADIRAEIRRHLDAVRACYHKSHARGPRVEGRVEMKFLIAPDGKVTQVALALNDTDLNDLPCCLADEIRGWQFPKPDGGGVVIVTYPFIFKHAPTDAP